MHRPGAQGLQRLVAVAAFADAGAADLGQAVAHQSAHGALVVDDHDLSGGGLGHQAPPGPERPAGLSGRNLIGRGSKFSSSNAFGSVARGVSAANSSPRVAMGSGAGSRRSRPAS